MRRIESLNASDQRLMERVGIDTPNQRIDVSGRRIGVRSEPDSLTAEAGRKRLKSRCTGHIAESPVNSGLQRRATPGKTGLSGQGA